MPESAKRQPAGPGVALHSRPTDRTDRIPCRQAMSANLAICRHSDRLHVKNNLDGARIFLIQALEGRGHLTHRQFVRDQKVRVQQPLTEQTNRSWEFAECHSRSDDLRLFDHERLEMHRTGLLAKARRDDPTRRSHHLHSLRERSFLALDLVPVTDAFNDAVGALASRDLQHALYRVSFARVDGMLGAEATRDREPKRLDVHDDGRRRARTMAEDVQHTQAELAAAEHDDRLARLHLPTSENVAPEAVDLDHRDDGHRNVVREGKHVACRHGNVLSKATGEIDADNFERATGTQPAGPARGTRVTRNERIDRDAIAAAESTRLVANLLHDATELVALNGGVLHTVGKLATIDVQIRAAQPCVGASDDDLARAHLRIRNVAEPNIAISVENAGFHGNVQSVAYSFMWILIAIGLGVLALAHTAPAPFLFDALARDRSVWHMPKRDRPTVYLTFDDGPNPTTTPDLLDVLAREQVSATFFLIDRHITERTAPLVRRLFDEGHAVALHSHTRAYMLMSPARFAQTLNTASAHIEHATGRRPCAAFRPHAGWRSWSMYVGLKRIDHRLIGWSWMLWDWNWFRRRTAGAVVNRVRDRARDGDIIVMHDGDESAPFADQRHTVDATIRLIPELRARGFSFGTVCENR